MTLELVRMGRPDPSVEQPSERLRSSDVSHVERRVPGEEERRRTSLEALHAFMRRHRYAVVATASPDQRPREATAGVAAIARIIGSFEMQRIQRGYFR
jgi:hypothetical protein